MTSQLATTQIAVLGLGAMGLPMALRLTERFPVRGFDPDEDAARRAGAAGVTTAATARQAATDADVLLVAVRNQDQLERVLYHPDSGVVPVLADGGVVLLTSTVGIEAATVVAERLAGDGLHLVDAPVSGGAARAGTGDLLIVVGASDEAYAVAHPVLEQLASTLQRMGPRPGDGQAMKTVNQLLCGVHVAAAAEALSLAAALGLDPEVTLRTLGAGAAASFMLGDRGPRMVRAYDDAGPELRSRLDIFVKDMGIVTGAARAAGLATPVAAAAEQLYLLGLAQGLGAEDDSALVKVVAPQARRPGAS